MPENIPSNYCYNKIEKKNYRKKRRENIRAIVNMINSARMQNRNLQYNREANRVTLYTTSCNEKICIHFPGKESEREKNLKPYDFKPVILKDDGLVINDMSFSDMFDIISQISDNDLLNAFALILFRISHLALHDELVENFYQKSSDIDENNVSIHNFEETSAASDMTLSFKRYKLQLQCERNNFDYATQNALRQIVGNRQHLYLLDNNGVHIENQFFSLEAFLYFIELLMLNEDIKYNFNHENNKIRLTQRGRKGTNDILQGFIFVKLGQIRLSSYLQGLTIGRGVIRLGDDDYRLISGLNIQN